MFALPQSDHHQSAQVRGIQLPFHLQTSRCLTATRLYPSICLSIFRLSIRPSIHLSIYRPATYLATYLSIQLSIYLPIFLHLSIYLHLPSIYIYLDLPIYLSKSVYIYLSISVYTYLHVNVPLSFCCLYLSISSYVCLCMCLPADVYKRMLSVCTHPPVYRPTFGRTALSVSRPFPEASGF